MTAIAGAYTPGASADRRLLETLTAAPPGDRGAVSVWAEGAVALGCANAPTTPESQDERQPLVDADGRTVVVWDGRLDNRRELAAVLDGRVEAAAGDAAYAAAAYREWGSDAPAHLRGDFAFAVWDARRRRLLLARDPLGVRVLFVARPGGGLVFASTLEQLLRHPGVSSEVDDDAALRYLYAPFLRLKPSFYRHAGPLGGGELLEADEDGVRTRDYWRWPADPPPASAPVGEALEQFRDAFTASVRRRLRASGPVAVLLSGGLDSGSIASVAGRLLRGGDSAIVRTYTHVFDRHPELDERRYSAAVTDAYDLPNTQVPGDDCWTLAGLETWLPVFTEPFFGAFDALFYETLPHTRDDGARVVLTGHGGDSMLEGSPRYVASLLARGRLHAVHRAVRGLAAARQRGYAFQLFARGIVPLLPSSLHDPLQRRLLGLGGVPAYAPAEIRDRAAGERTFFLHRGRDAWWYALHEDLTRTGKGFQNAYFDRLGRLFGLEVRQPMFDVDLTELVLRLPPSAFFRNGRPRRLQVDGLADVLPRAVRERTDKASFGPLFDAGLRRHRRRFVEELTRDSELARRGYADGHAWRADVLAYLERGTPRISWFALTLELWLRHRENRLPPLE